MQHAVCNRRSDLPSVGDRWVCITGGIHTTACQYPLLQGAYNDIYTSPVLVSPGTVPGSVYPAG